MGLVGLFTQWLPGYGENPLLLPWGTDELIQNIISSYYGAIETLPYLKAGLTAFAILITFEMTLLLLKLFLGSRTPMSHN